MSRKSTVNELLKDNIARRKQQLWSCHWNDCLYMDTCLTFLVSAQNLTVSEVSGLLGANVAELKSYENQSLVRSWISQQPQSELDSLGLGLTGGKVDSTNNTNTNTEATTTSTPSNSAGTTTTGSTNTTGEYWKGCMVYCCAEPTLPPHTFTAAWLINRLADDHNWQRMRLIYISLLLKSATLSRKCVTGLSHSI